MLQKSELKREKQDLNDWIRISCITNEKECLDCGGEIPPMEDFYTPSYRMEIILCQTCYNAEKKWATIP